MTECNTMDLDFKRYNSAILAFIKAFNNGFEHSENVKNNLNLNLINDLFSISDSEIIILQSKIKFEIIGIIKFIWACWKTVRAS
jgi:hypothetical protein